MAIYIRLAIPPRPIMIQITPLVDAQDFSLSMQPLKLECVVEAEVLERRLGIV